MCHGCQWGWKRLHGGKFQRVGLWDTGGHLCVMDLGFLVRGGARALPGGTDGDLGSVGSVPGGGCGDGEAEPAAGGFQREPSAALEREFLPPAAVRLHLVPGRSLRAAHGAVPGGAGPGCHPALPIRESPTGPNWAKLGVLGGGSSSLEMGRNPHGGMEEQGHSFPGMDHGMAQGWNWPRAEGVSCCPW